MILRFDATEKYMKNDLIENIQKIYSTKLGIIRIRNNLKIKTNNVVEYCKNIVKEAEEKDKKGKNWYVYKGDCIITINANTYTIITAHRRKKSKSRNNGT